MPKIKAVIFDLDGTLVDSQPAWRAAEERLFEKLGHPFDPAIAARYRGMNALDVGRTIHRCLGPVSLSEDQCAGLLRDYVLESAGLAIPPMPGATGLLRSLSGTCRMAVASGSPLGLIKRIVRDLGWEDLFHALVSSEEVVHGKPAPDVFIEAANRLGIEPEAALVVEDSVNGALAARAAGMSCFAVGQEPDLLQAADRVFASLSEITVRDLEALDRR